MIYFTTRAKARNFAGMFQRCKVLDIKDNPSRSGKRWAVRVLLS